MKATKEQSDEIVFANALLISKAPEMLEMLTKIAKDNLWGSDDDYRKLKKLINEATNI